ncbi:MAG TPA: hypothetical protein VFF04_00855 [Candidatus Babeliales bacterium]|nr:hypothetical protein [Candidatus Babeliales bacterium]
MGKKRILLKITGEILLDSDKKLSSVIINSVIAQIKQLLPTHQFGIVIGGGNFFRGSEYSASLGIDPAVGHQAGMLATMMNGLIIKDLFEKQEIKTELLCAIPAPGVGSPTSQQSISMALNAHATLIFTGGTGNPFFTTDTNAVLRGLQIGADEIWKGTKVDGVYDADPNKNLSAKLLKQVPYSYALEHHLAIMDATAFAMAQQYKQKIRVFNIFAEQALINAAHDQQFGSIIY